MKKIFVYFAVLAAMLLMVGCGGGSTTGDNTDTGTTETDEDSVDSGSTDTGTTEPTDTGTTEPTDTGTTEPTDTGTTEPTDTGEPDTAPDEGDSQPDESDTEPDDGDTAPEPDGDSGDSTSEHDEDNADSGDSASDQDADSGDSGDPTPDQDADSGDSGIIEQMEEGIYLGIIGFNDDLTTKQIMRLTDTNKDEFKNFIGNLQQKNYTALYWADYSALDMMENFTISPDLQLKKVALVTFTDGLDNQSLALDEFNPGPYDSQADYMNAIHSMIMDEEGIHGQPVTAYSIGLKGSDVTDDNKFRETLEKLASESDNEEEKYVFQVTDMSEVENHFAAIADSLYQVSTTINVGVYIPGGYDNGQVIRYTFDNVAAAASSSLYIEATYHRSGSQRTLENINYQGFMQGASTISSSSTGPHGELYFQFDDLKYSDGSPVSQSEIMSKSRLWKQTSSGGWDGESEMNMQELPPVIDEDKSSALIMLVLDSTTSLGSDFARMQQAAKKFVETLVSGGSGVTTDPAAEECAALGGTWNSSQSKCKREQSCSSKPANTVWNTVSTIEQTWNGTSWQPSTASEYNTSGSTQYCRFKCVSADYDWNGSTCQSNSSGGSKSLGEICTNQTTCYNASSSMTCPSSSSADFYGQDAQYTSKCTPQSFSSSSNVVIDNNTGLTWEKSPSSGTYTWANRATHCNELNSSNYGGINTWRVPNPLELLTIVDNSRYNPATNSNFTNMPTENSTYLWTSKEYISNTNSAYYFSPSYGWYYYTGKSSTYKVLCVSGDEMQPATSADFTTQTISGKVVVTDSKTGLMWQKEYASSKTWQQALKYCEDSTYAGYSDWRLPNKNELSSLINYEKSGSPYSYFPDMPSNWFWSSSTFVGNTNLAWRVNFNNGYVNYSNKTYNINVRCVR